MDDVVVATHLEKIDHRLDRIEQILPTLATKEELTRLATKEDLTRLATKEELRAAVAPLATRQELGDLRSQMTMLFEQLRSDIQLLAEHLSAVMTRLGL